MRVILLTLTFLCFGINSNSQKLSFGPELGTNLVMLEKTDLGKNYHMCWFAGSKVEYDFFDYFSLRSGVYFSQRKKMFSSEDTSEFSILGFKPSDLGIPGVDFSTYTKTQTVVSLFGVELPILAAFKYKGFSAFAGPYFNFRVGAWSKTVEDSYTPFLQAIQMDSIDQSGFLTKFFPAATTHTFYETSEKKDYLKVDYGFKFGMSYEVNNIGFNLYYVQGIPGFMVDKKNVLSTPHRYFSFTINYAIDWKKSSQSSFVH